MKRMKKRTVIGSAVLLMVSFLTVSAQEENDFYGDFLFGYRYVDTSGALTKYKEDFNLFDGIRLFRFNIHYQPQNEGLFDRLDVYADNLGGDPFETLSVYIQKFGNYRFRFDRRKSAYFYNDMREAGGHLYDLHTFDYERVRDSGSLKVALHDSVDLIMDFDRYSKEGESVTTFDINRIEFEFDSPINEEYRNVSIGLQVRLNSRYSFLIQEQVMDYENSSSLFLPGFADGGPEARYPSALKYFHLNQPYAINSNLHALKVNAQPFDNLILQGAVQLRGQDLDLDYSESAAGTNYLNRLFSYSFSGTGSFEREIQLYDFDATYLLMNKLAVLGAVRYHDFEQEGTLAYDGVSETSFLGYSTLGFESGLQYQFSPGIAASAGYRREAREYQGTETVNFEEQTVRSGFYGNLNLRISRLIRVSADYQHGIYDNPFTLISPTDFYRTRITAGLSYEGFSVDASYLRNQTASDILGELWESYTDRVHFRAGYRAGPARVSAGYTLINTVHESERIVSFPPSWYGSGTFAWDVFYEGRSNLLNASLNYDISEQIKIGAYGNYYDNSGTWELSRTMLNGFIEYMFSNGLVSHFRYRYIDFNEERSSTNNYSADIVEISFGYRWK